MKTIISVSCAVLSMVLALPTNATEPDIATQFDFSSDTTPGARKFYFETIPGHRYTLWRSTNLKDWSPVAGYPQTAAGLSIEHTFTQDVKEFFRVEPIDDQVPEIVSQYPVVDGFAVGRFADLSIELKDATGIDPASIRLTVGASGQLAPGAPGLTISGSTISYDSGDAALGAWGATISATLVAADTLGHTLTHTWSFRLEPEPQTAANIFVFGSPAAQRSGQRVSGPAAALASRYPAPVGPQKANAQSPWSIESVLADRIVIAYESGAAPSFSEGQLICNLAPTKESEIFYRRVISTSNDVGNLKLTVITVDVPLTEFISSGSAAISQNSVIFDLDENGTLTAARAAEGPGIALLPEIPLDLSRSSFKLLENGYQTTIAGVTLTSGGGETLVDIEAQELCWKFYPQFRAGIELREIPFPLSKFVESADAVFTGRASCAVVLRATGRLAGNFSERPIIHVPIGKVAFIGSIGTVPIYTSVRFDFTVKTKASVQALIVSEMTYRQAFQASFGLEYRKATGLDWVNSFQVDKPELGGNSALTGEFSLELTIEPKATALVYGTAGFQASLEPSGKITTRASTTTTPPFVALGGEIEASLDFVIQPAGLFFDVIYPVNKPKLSFPVWNDEWPLTAQTLAFKTQPLSQTVAPGANVTFSCSVDAPSALSFQWYHNNVILPLQTSRSLFLNRVTSGHGGNYFVRAKAGNQSIDSQIVTLTVQTQTPETLDSDNDGIPNIHETNTGIWVSATNRGTNPNKWDTDGDGLSDGVETNTRVYVSRGNTGTNPNFADTDKDHVDDKREIDLGTDPNASLPTIRPKTMDGIVLALDSSAHLEFVRGRGSDPAVLTGDVETGAFIYTPKVASHTLKLYENLNGDQSNFLYPLRVTAATYTYRAINDSSGVLTLNATGDFDLFFNLPTGANIAHNASWIRLFYSYSSQASIRNTRVAEVAITFKDNVSFVTSEVITLRLPESPLVNTFDTVQIPSTVSLATLAPVPKNYNPTLPESAPSRIAPASLSNRLMVATNGIPDSTKDFTIQFVSDASVPDLSAGSEEIGLCILSVYDPSLIPPRLTPVGIALDYTWRRILGTDRGELVLSNIPNNPALPFASSLNGAFSFNFTGTETGNYSGAADADTSNPADVSGTFFLPASN